jgi:hypothetical protein
MIFPGLLPELVLLSTPMVHSATTSPGRGLTTAEASIIAAASTALAVLTVGVLNVWTQRKQLSKQEQQSNKQLDEQRKLLERQLETQREQSNQQLDAQRDQFNLQLAEQRDLRRAEQDAETAKTTRAEKKAAYVKVLAACRNTQAIWQLIAYEHPQSLLANLQSATANLAEERDQLRTGLAEIELLGSQDVIKLATSFTERTGDLLTRFISSSESAIQRSGQPTPNTLAEAQAAVREELAKSKIPKIYSEMQATMRREILGEPS